MTEPSKRTNRYRCPESVCQLPMSAKDKTRARSHARDACDSGHPVGCNILARAYEDGEVFPVDFAKARSLYQKVCQGGYADACRALERLGK